jgi:hypothetical protein
VYTVTNTADAGAGSLRQAILDANANVGADQIKLGFTATTIVPVRSPLPTITGDLSIKGGEYLTSPLILDGTEAGANTDGLVINGPNVNVFAVEVRQFRYGVVSQGSNVVLGMKVDQNRAGGFRVLSPGTVINSDVDANGGLPVDVADADPTANDAADADGWPNVPTVTSVVATDASHAVITGTYQGRPNSLIQLTAFTHPRGDFWQTSVATDGAGHAAFSIDVYNLSVGSSATVWATYLGQTSEFAPAVAVTIPRGMVVSTADAGPGTLRQAILDTNASPGRDTISVGVSGITVLGALPEITGPVDIVGNSSFPAVISGPGAGAAGFDGLRLSASDSTVNGVAVTGFRHAIVVQGSNDVLGASGPVLLYRNTGDGVRVMSGTSNRVATGVRAFYNGGLPIDLGGDGPTPNDPGDGDAGANGLQNAPVITSALRQGANVLANGSLTAAPGTYALTFYAARDADWGVWRVDSSELPIATASVTVGAGGVATFALTLPADGFSADRVLAATATDIDGNTSEVGGGAAVTYPTFAVTTTADSGAGSLRQAILDANARPGPDAITFAIPGAGVHRITLASALPAVTDTASIDASTQPGCAGAPRVELVGTPSMAYGLLLDGAATDSLVRGLAIGGFAKGIWLAPARSRLAGSYVGLMADGTTLANTGDGVYVTGAKALVGGYAAADRNVISGNGVAGVRLAGDDEVVAGNYVGTDPAGGAARANLDGVGVERDAHRALIGGTIAAARNVIAGSVDSGVYLSGSSGSVVVAGNYIGTNAAGDAAVPNRAGVSITGYFGSGTVIGGTIAAARNVISGNKGNGVEAALFSVPILGNAIGVAADGATPLGNGASGVQVYYSGSAQVGGTGPGEGNVIAYNGGDGVAVGGYAGVRGNTFRGNGGMAIEVGPTGLNANDFNDLDAGANDLMNYPVIAEALPYPATTRVTGMLDAGVFQTRQLDFYASAAPGSPGGVFLGTATVTANADGVATFDVTLPTAVPVGMYESATSSNAYATSEFAPAIAARRPADATGDGRVDFNDLVVLAQNYNGPAGQTWASGDFTGDGLSDFSDLVVLAQNYNTGPAAEGATAAMTLQQAMAAAFAPPPVVVAPPAVAKTATPKRAAKPEAVFSVKPVKPPAKPAKPAVGKPKRR